MGYLLHLMFRCDGNVMFLWGFLRELNRAQGRFWIRILLPRKARSEIRQVGGGLGGLCVTGREPEHGTTMLGGFWGCESRLVAWLECFVWEVKIMDS